MVDEATKLATQANTEFDKVNFRIEFLAKQRNAALDQVLLVQERLEVSQLELKKAYARINELLPLVEKAGTNDQQLTTEATNEQDSTQTA